MKKRARDIMPRFMKKVSKKTGLPPGTLIHVGEKKTEKIRIRVMAYDEENLEEKDLDNTLKLISKYGKQFLFSIPFKGDPNLEADSTHKIKQTKEWWMTKLGQYFIIGEAPEDWMFNNQLLIGSKK